MKHAAAFLGAAVGAFLGVFVGFVWTELSTRDPAADLGDDDEEGGLLRWLMQQNREPQCPDYPPGGDQ